MIGYLEGRLLGIDKNNILINVNHVGYRVTCAPRLYQNLNLGENIALYTEMVVRENDIRLYGFANQSECEWFALLGTVQGVGAKMAMALLTDFTPKDLMQIILSGTGQNLTAAQGVGKKLAERILHELHDKLPNALDDSGAGDMSADTGNIQNFQIALEALMNLGFARNIAQQSLIAIQKHSKNKDSEFAPDEILRLALQHLDKSKKA